MKLFVIIGSVLFFASSILAAEFTASVDKNKTSPDDDVLLTLTLTGSQDAGEPEIPDMDDFEIVSSGSSSQFSFINGKMSSSKRFTYSLMPLKEGTLTIPSIPIIADGATLQTEPITVEIMKGAAPAAARQPQRQSQAGYITQTEQEEEEAASPTQLKDKVFIEVRTDKDTVYIGEQVTLIFKLYRQNVMIDNLQYAPPATKGFVTESMGNQKEYRDIKDGVLYEIVELKTAIFPASAGEFTIDPAQLRCDLLVKEQRQRRRTSNDFFDNFFEDPFFNTYVRHPLNLKSDPIKLTVKDFPQENRPDTFKSAVGVYDLNIEAEPRALKVGEPINLVMKVTGAGNISQVSEPLLKDTTGFKTYDSEVKTDITGRDPLVEGEKIFRKMIIPQSDSIKEIPIIVFSYFDPIQNQYKTISKGPIPITVTPGTTKQTEIVGPVQEAGMGDETKKSVTLLAKNIHYIKTSSGNFTVSKKLWHKNVIIWLAIVIIPVIMLIALSLFNAHKMKLSADSAYARTKGAHKIAKKLLAEAVKARKHNKHKEFHDAIAKALQKFVSDRLNVPIGTVTSTNLANLLSPRRIDYGTIVNIKSVFDAGDQIRFGGHTSSLEEMDKVLKNATKLIEILGKYL